MSTANLGSSNIKRPYIGVGTLVWKGDFLLLGKRLNSHGEGEWQFPGGHLELGETVTDCAVREVLEETGIEIIGMVPAGYTNEMMSVNDRQYLTLYVSAAYVSGELKVLEPEKCECWQWFKYDELPTPLFQPIINLLRQVPSLNVLQVGPGTPAGAHK